MGLVLYRNQMPFFAIPQKTAFSIIGYSPTITVTLGIRLYYQQGFTPVNNGRMLRVTMVHFYGAWKLEMERPNTKKDPDGLPGMRYF